MQKMRIHFEDLHRMRKIRALINAVWIFCKNGQVMKEFWIWCKR